MNIKTLKYRILKKIFHEKKLNDSSLLSINIISAAMVHEGNHFLFDHAINNAPQQGAFIEIGSFSGQSTNIICYLMRKYKRENVFYSCDKWDFGKNFIVDNANLLNIPYESYRQFIKESFIRNLNFLGGGQKPYALEVFSDEFFDKWNSKAQATDVFNRACHLGGDISFAFIDGNHTYDFVKRDFENVDMSLVKGGFILFDDSADHWSFGSSVLMREMKRNKNYKFIYKNPNYLFQKIK